LHICAACVKNIKGKEGEEKRRDEKRGIGCAEWPGRGVAVAMQDLTQETRALRSSYAPL
jgi:hypothetical protein